MQTKFLGVNWNYQEQFSQKMTNQDVLLIYMAIIMVLK